MRRCGEEQGREKEFGRKVAAVMKGNRSNTRKKILLEEVKKLKAEPKALFWKGKRANGKKTD